MCGRGVAAQRRTVHEEPAHARGGVIVLHAGGVSALGGPDPAGAPTDPQRGVLQPGAQGELPYARVEQGLERVRGGTTQRFHHLLVHKGPKNGGEPVPPAGLELVGGRQRGAVLDGGEVGQRLPAPPQRGRVLGAQPPVPEPLVEGAQAVRVVQLRGEHRCHAEGQHVPPALPGEPAQQVHHRQVGVRPRLVQPLLTHRPGAVVGEPRQVAVQHETERALLAAARARVRHGAAATATRSRQASRSPPCGSPSCRSKSAAVSAATSDSSGSGHTACPGSEPSTTSSWASMTEPP